MRLATTRSTIPLDPSAPEIKANRALGKVTSVDLELMSGGDSHYVRAGFTSEGGTTIFAALTPDDAVELAEQLRFFAERIKRAQAGSVESAS